MKHPSSLNKRRQAGAWLKKLRMDAGLTQSGFAERLGFPYYAVVSQVETGRIRVPIQKLQAWAEAVGVDPTEFTKRLLSFYEPELHRLLYERKVRHNQPGGAPDRASQRASRS
jgi:transcriptional regulator with XRE-family HTH domain